MNAPAPLEIYRPRASSPSEIKAVVKAARDLVADVVAIVQEVEAALILTDADAADRAVKTGSPVRYREDVLSEAVADLRRHVVGLAEQLAFVPVPPSAAPRLGRGPRRAHQADGGRS